MYTIEQLSREIREVNQANGWGSPTLQDFVEDANYVLVKLALIHTEVSEAVEAVRKEDLDNFAEELADTAIRLFDLAYTMDIDLGRRIRDKVEVNKGRGYRHGGKKA